MRIRFRLGTAGLLVLIGTANDASADEPTPMVTVTGTAVVRTVPDVIVWKIETEDNDPELAKAKKASDDKLRAILGLREELGIKVEDVQTGYLSVRKIYERDRQGNRREFKHFTVTRKVTIKQRDLKRFDEYLGKLLASAEMEVQFSFESSRYHELRSKTRLQAVSAAKKKAAAMVEALDAKLGKVHTIEEPEPSGYLGQNWASNMAYVNPESPSPEDSAGGTFAPGAIEIKVSVRVAFAIE